MDVRTLLMPLRRKAIYFDGALPPEKLPTRMERTATNTLNARQFYQGNPRGCPADTFFSSREAAVLFNVQQGRGRELPYNPFTVPTVIDAIRRSPRWANITHIVPGEADAFCAAAAAEAPRTVLTTDSDLLVYDLGESSVVF